MANGTGNPNGAPWWSQLVVSGGILGVIVLFLIGAVPGTRSPIDRLAETYTIQTNKIAESINKHNEVATTAAIELQAKMAQMIFLESELLRLRRQECLRATKGDTGTCEFPGTWVPDRSKEGAAR